MPPVVLAAFGMTSVIVRAVAGSTLLVTLTVGMDVVVDAVLCGVVVGTIVVYNVAEG